MYNLSSISKCFLCLAKNKIICILGIQNPHAMRLNIINQTLILTIALFLSSSLLNAQNRSVSTVDNKKMLHDFFSMEMVYPEKALENNISGDVRIIVEIDEKGQMIDYSISQSVDPEIDKEAIRIMKKICWLPALSNGKKVKGKQVLEIPFHVRKYKKQMKRRGYNQIPNLDLANDTNFVIYPFRKANSIPTPDFPNGKKLGQFLSEQLQYPEAASRLGIRGTVTLKFIVETSGNSSNVIVEKDLGGGCTEEAMRLLKLIRWIPAQKDGQPVRVGWSLDIAFQVNRSGVGQVTTPGNNGL